MKNLIKIVVVAVLFCCGEAYAQTALKIAHINTQDLIMTMPERDAAVKELEALQKELGQEYELLQVEFNKKYQDYLANSKNLTDLVRTSREQELQDMSRNMSTFEQSAQEEISKKNSDLMSPITDKITKTIADVAKEQNITYVLDSSPGMMLYKSLDAIDLLPAVQAKMGIKK